MLREQIEKILDHKSCYEILEKQRPCHNNKQAWCDDCRTNRILALFGTVYRKEKCSNKICVNGKLANSGGAICPTCHGTGEVFEEVRR